MQSQNKDTPCHSDSTSQKKDYLLWFSSIVVLGGGAFYMIVQWMELSLPLTSYIFIHYEYILLKQMWLGIMLGIVSVGLLSYIPREIVMGILGPGQSVKGLLRAVMAGLFLDMCSHGILMIGMKLYERGASLGQMMTFLIASPWNSFSLSLILLALIGWQWTLLFILLSAVIAFISGLIFEFLVAKQMLPSNPHQCAISQNFNLKSELHKLFHNKSFHLGFVVSVLKKGFQGAKVIIKWTFIGIIVASLIRAWVPQDIFANYFGATFLGLFLTVLVASVIEVCSEGSTPIAAEFMKQAPGNTFAFLMTGVSTDYTEIIVIKKSCSSWKIALFLPLITLPQIFAISLLINNL